MRWTGRSMRSRLNWGAIACSALLASGCAGGGGAGDGEPEAGEILKISYFRPHPNPKTKKPEPTYKVVMSEAWRDRVGEFPREPFAKAAPGASYKGFMGDLDMKRFYQMLRSKGIGTLRASDPDAYNPQDLNKSAVDPRQYDPQGQPYVRIITVGTDQWHRSYALRDQQVVSTEAVEAFLRCEKLVVAMVQSSLLIKTDAHVTFPRDR